MYKKEEDDQNDPTGSGEHSWLKKKKKVRGYTGVK
jgi:hypothetical protein